MSEVERIKILVNEVREGIEFGFSFTLVRKGTKRPYRKGWTTEKALPLNLLLSHIEEGGNIGVRTGKPSGIVILDVDTNKKTGELRIPPGLPKTVVAKTGGGGRHYLYRIPHDVSLKNDVKDEILGELMDIRTDGGQAVYPGSRHENGEVYTWAPGHSPRECDIAELPASAIAPKVLSKGRARSRKRGAIPKGGSQLEAAVKAIAEADEGERNVILNSKSFAIAKLVACGTIDRSKAESALLDAALQVELPEDEALNTIHSAMDAGITKLKDVLVVKSIAPMVLVQLMLDELYSDSSGVFRLAFYKGDFFQFAGEVWIEIEPGFLRADVYAFCNRVRVVNSEGELVPMKVNMRAVSDFLDALKASAILVRTEAPCWLNGEENMPSPSSILAFPNGLLDTTTRNFLSPTPAFFTPLVASFAFSQSPPTPEVWEKTLDSMFEKDLEARELLQEIMGYPLKFGLLLQAILFIVGPTRSGKSTIGRLILKLLGKTGVATPSFDSLGERFGTQSLIGKKLALFNDARLSRKANAQRTVQTLLSISGEDSINIDRKNKEEVSLELRIKFLIFTNEIPHFIDASGALAARFVILKLSKSFLGHEDQNLFEKLERELSAILLWALDGADRLEERGKFIEPASSLEARTDLIESFSPLRVFVDEYCVLGSEFVEDKKVLFGAYTTWCVETGRRHPSHSSGFGKELKNTFPEVREGPRRRIPEGGQTYTYMGIGLLSNGQREEFF